jgi:hypothetical protein
MSSCSDREAIFAMLDGIGNELQMVGSEILRLGEALSELMDAPLDFSQMQSFDALSQNTLAQARLIIDLARLARDESVSSTTLLGLIEDVPFLSVRQRLRAAIGHPADQIDEELTDDDAVALWQTLVEDGQATVS